MKPFDKLIKIKKLNLINEIRYINSKKKKLNEDLFYQTGSGSIYRGDYLKFSINNFNKLPEDIKKQLEPEKEYELIGHGGKDPNKTYYVLEDRKSGKPIVVNFDSLPKYMTALTVGRV